MKESVNKEIFGSFIRNKDKSTYEIMASTGDVDRDHEIVAPASFQNLHQYLSKNPVILFAHRRDLPPIAKAVDGEILTNGLKLIIEFAKTQFAEEIHYLYDEGFMNAFSIGFIGLDWDFNPDGLRVFTKTELLETSAVPVPANESAIMLRMAKNKGKTLTECESIFDAFYKVKPSKGNDLSPTAKRIKLFAKSI